MSYNWEGGKKKGVEGGNFYTTAAPRSQKCCENGHTCMGALNPLHHKTQWNKRDG